MPAPDSPAARAGVRRLVLRAVVAAPVASLLAVSVATAPAPAENRLPNGSPEVGSADGPGSGWAEVDPADVESDPTSTCTQMRVVDRISGSGARMRLRIFGSDREFRIATIPSAWWRDPPVDAAVWQMYFRGLMWMGAAIDRAQRSDDPAAIEALVRAAVTSVRANPDPGRAVRGWDEGTNLRRQQSLNCLFIASGRDPRLVPAIEMTARANLDMRRYYGPPAHLVHNHGVMANQHLLTAGILLNRPSWRRVAVQRLATAAGSAFTREGFSVEQSSGYGYGNIAVWQKVATELAADTDPAVRAKAAVVRAEARRARSAVAYLTDPSGTLVPYGDSNARPGIVAAQPTTMIRDDSAGVIAGRWSWHDPLTSHYVLRYGGPRTAHGHEDRTSLVFFTMGVPVLVDPGRYSYDSSALRTFQISAAGHNTQQVRGRSYRGSAPVRVTRQRASGTMHSITTSDALYGIAHTRTWSMDNARRQVRLTDSVAAPSTTTLHLDAAWRLTALRDGARTAVFTNTAHRVRRLTVSTTSPMRVYSGRTGPVLGWVFPSYGVRRAAPEVVFGSPAGRSGATLTVS